jgi:site-specific DNA-methyltransferase (adenine-specific)
MFELNKLYNMDCLAAMKEIPDKFFELAIVDPPYGGGSSQNINVERERAVRRHSGL